MLHRQPHHCADSDIVALHKAVALGAHQSPTIEQQYALRRNACDDGVMLVTAAEVQQYSRAIRYAVVDAAHDGTRRSTALGGFDNNRPF